MDREPSLQLDDIEDDCYALLGTPVGASEKDIRRAYMRLAKEWHPDRHQGDEAAKDVFQRITRAHQILTNPVAREEHDHKFDCLSRLNFQAFLQRYFYFLFSPQGLGLEVSDEQRQQTALEQCVDELVEQSLSCRGASIRAR